MTSPRNENLKNLAQRIYSRRTVKLYLKTPVDRQLVIDAIDLARWAPNHHLTEPWHFYILGKETIRAAVELTRIVVTERFDADKGNFKAEAHAAIPGWMVVSCRSSDDALLEREDYASCCCAIQNLMLYLSEAGVATKWATGAITRDDRFYELLGMDRNKEFIVALLWYGYPKVTPTQTRPDVRQNITELD